MAMIEGRRAGDPRRGRRTGLAPLLAALFALLLAACAPAAAPPATGAPVSPIAQATATPAPPATDDPSASAAPPPSTEASPSTEPTPSIAINRERCPLTLPEPDLVTADGIAIEGDDAFVKHVQRALDLLADDAPNSYADVVGNVTRVRQVESFSGMCYDSGTFRVGEETAYAPGHPEKAQVQWLAGTIVHDGCHRALFVAGEAPSGRDAELACLILQEKALRRIEDRPTFADYVQTLIDGVDDPANQYWNNPDRHW
jgi:hypothetical protein